MITKTTKEQRGLDAFGNPIQPVDTVAIIANRSTRSLKRSEIMKLTTHGATIDVVMKRYGSNAVAGINRPTKFIVKIEEGVNE